MIDTIKSKIEELKKRWENDIGFEENIYYQTKIKQATEDLELAEKFVSELKNEITHRLDWNKDTDGFDVRCIIDNLTKKDYSLHSQQNKTIGLYANATATAKAVPEIDKPADKFSKTKTKQENK